jgi:hypothetical protein
MDYPIYVRCWEEEQVEEEDEKEEDEGIRL